MIILILAVVLFLLLGALSLFTGIFLYSCKLAGLPSPGKPKAAIVVITTAVIWAGLEGLLVAVLHMAYAAFNGPAWEVWLAGFFAGVPLSLLAGTILHRLLMRVPLAKAIEVWCFERLIRYSLVTVGGTILGLAWLALK
jgi:hypothetical protein